MDFSKIKGMMGNVGDEAVNLGRKARASAYMGKKKAMSSDIVEWIRQNPKLAAAMGIGGVGAGAGATGLANYMGDEDEDD